MALIRPMGGNPVSGNPEFFALVIWISALWNPQKNLKESGIPLKIGIYYSSLLHLTKQNNLF